jgi:hypothetical protein
LLEKRDGKGGRFTGSGLRLRNDVVAFDAWHDPNVCAGRGRRDVVARIQGPDLRHFQAASW